MHLAKRKGRGAEYRHPLFQYDLPALTKEDIPPLLERLRAGDKEAKEIVILGHVRFALAIVGRYVAVIGPNLVNDMVGAAMEGVVVAVDKTANGDLKHDALTQYIGVTVHRFISTELGRRQVVHIPHQTLSDRRLGKYGNTDMPAKPKRVDFDDPAVLHATAKRGEVDLEIKEILELVIENDLQRSILTLRGEGKTDEQVAAELDLSKTSVFVIRKELEHRFLELFYA